MYTRNKADAPKRNRLGLTCHLLLQENDVRGDHLAVTWVDILPGSMQRPHRHVPEQIYVIIRGRGKMKVDNAVKEIGVGDIVYIPSNSIHGIENISDETLTYISAATPAFDVSAMYDTGALRDNGDQGQGEKGRQ